MTNKQKNLVDLAKQATGAEFVDAGFAGDKGVVLRCNRALTGEQLGQLLSALCLDLPDVELWGGVWENASVIYVRIPRDVL